MSKFLYETDADLLPEPVLDALKLLVLALVDHTDFVGVQITFNDLTNTQNLKPQVHVLVPDQN